MAFSTLLQRVRREKPAIHTTAPSSASGFTDGESDAAPAVQVVELHALPLNSVEVEPRRPLASSTPSRRCHDHAKRLIHKYAAFGTAWALLPVPMATSAGLAILETHLIYWIARIYGEEPKKTDVLMTAAGLNLASVGLKTLAMESAALVPGVGLGVKASIAGSVVLGIGRAILSHYEEKYPEKLIAA